MRAYYERDRGRFKRGVSQPKTEAHRASLSAACKRAWETKRTRVPVGSVGHTSHDGYAMVKVRDGRWRAQHAERAEEMIGRSLVAGEVVHHIDIDRSNNAHENLHVFASRSDHNRGHASLNRLVAGLLRDGVIRFDRASGEYIR